MTSLFDEIALFDNGKRTASRQAAAVAQKRVADQFGDFFKVAKSTEELEARYDFAEEQVRQIVAEVAEEYDADVENLQDAIDEHIKGEGVTDLDKDLEEAPSAVGEKSSSSYQDEYHEKNKTCPTCNGSGYKDELQDNGTCPTCHGAGSVEKTASGNGHRSDCNCGFCANAGNIGGSSEEESVEEESSPVEASVKEAEAPKDGGGAVKRESLPTGDGKSIGTQPSPKIDKRTWKPNALNENGNLKPIDAEQSGSPHPTEHTDVSDLPDHSNDFLEDTDAVTESQSLPSADDSGVSTEKNISQDSQGGTWSGTEGQADPVTASADPDQNPLREILESEFATDHQVESAIREFESQ